MLIILKHGATQAEVEAVAAEVRRVGYRPHVSEGEHTTLVGAIGKGPTPELLEHFRALTPVQEVIPISKPYKLASLEVSPKSTVLKWNTGMTGGGEVLIAAGPCGVESAEQTLTAAHYVKRHGAQMLRGGAFNSDDAGLNVPLRNRAWTSVSDESAVGVRIAAPVPGSLLPVPEPKSVKNRMHLDLRSDEDAGAVRERLLALGATKLSEGRQGPHTWWTMADPEGNEFCV